MAAEATVVHETYTTMGGTVLDLTGLDERERGFLECARQRYEQGEPWAVFANWVHSPENPLIAAADGLVTRDVYHHSLYRAVRDLADRLGIVQHMVDTEPGLDLATNPFDDEWLPMLAAVARRGVTRTALHEAIRRGDVIARPARSGGTWRVVSRRSLDAWQPSRGPVAAARQAKILAHAAA